MFYGLIGEKLSHSFSKEIHSMIGDYGYRLIEIPKENLKAFFEKREFNGINVTIPYKTSIMQYLDFVDSSAKKIGSVNTVVNKDGKLYGYNTDYYGLLETAKHFNIDFCGKEVAVLGTGGTSKTAYAVSKELGAKEIYKVSRTKKENALSYEEFCISKNPEIIINTTPIGMYPETDCTALDIKPFSRLWGVIDCVYNPLNTKLVLHAKENGINAVGGLYMLISQAVHSAKLFSVIKSTADITESIYKKILKLKQNIVLCGMPSCGKSTVGELLAKELNRTFIDTDTAVAKKENMQVKDIINTKGEAYFRSAEEKAVKEISLVNGNVIALGGGTVLKNENVLRLKQNGKIYFIDRPLEFLTPTSDRPLSSNKSALNKLYCERYGIYKSVADKTVSLNGTPEDFANLIKEDFLK